MEQILSFIFKYLTEIIVGGSVVFLIVIVIFVTNAINNKDRREYSNIIANLTSPRVFVLDFGEGEVTYFNRGHYSERKSGALAQFYQQFTAREVDELEAWINTLLVPKSGASLVYKTDVFVRSERRSYASVLEVSKIDYEQKIIHLESYLYRYLKPNNQMNLAVKKRENIGYLGSSELAKLYRRRFIRTSGIYAAINVENMATKKDGVVPVSAHVWYELQNQTAFYRSVHTIIRFAKDNTVGIYLPHAQNEAAMMDIVKAIIQRMEGFLQINGYEEYSLGAGIVRGKEFSDPYMAIKTAEELSVYAHNNDTQILIYDPTREVKTLDLSLYRNELNQIVATKGVDPMFQPLVVSSTAAIHGYLTSFTLKSPLFSSYSELKTFASENKLSHGLCIMCLRKSAASYYNARRNAKQKLFLPLDIENVSCIDEAFAKLPFAQDIPFVFMLEEQNFSEMFVHLEDMLDIVSSIKALGHEVALVITDTELTLPDDIYSVVDYFMVDENILVYTHDDERERLYLLAMLGKLLRHTRPIAISGLAKWSEIEYYVRAGVDLIASDEISKKDLTVNTIEKKKALRIINFSKRK